ncbi:DNA-binding transcriptional regulator, LysR family [Paenibacillus sp. yr247]|uniref:LysR family transcriptional regulator n=1 Tax=Paenibacillus sp. yr247 TaxID=1761880 RepID=UPI00087E61B9|nr:LysR family transcriptional regulator [Paenibacillus sp. yr247]SDO84553.1 DNA-binding transcriptional regulator, LysR family [Paenibacillus sp. yr247]
MDFKYLETFCTVAQELSFLKAAEKLNYAQSSVTAHIQHLEKEMGITLFERNGRTIGLTGPGQRFLPFAYQLLSLMNEAKCAALGKSDSSGIIRVGMLESLCIYRFPLVLKQFHDMHPEAEVQLKPSTYSDLHRALLEDLDLAIITDDRIHSNSLVTMPLLLEKVLLLTHPGHILARSGLDHTALEKETFLLTEPSCRYRKLFEQSIAERGLISVVKRIELSSIEAIKQCAINKLGIAVLPEMAVLSELLDGRLAALNMDFSKHRLYTQLVWHKRRWKSPAVQAFIDVTTRFFSQNSPEANSI